MGLGSYGTGIGPLGIDPVISSDRKSASAAPQALLVDGVARDFLLDANGRYVGAHWVDAAVFQKLRVQQGSIRSAPGEGETVSKIQYIDKARIQSQVEDRVKVALADLLSRKLISIQSITLDTRTKGRILYAVDYVNLVTATKQKTPSLLAF